MIQLNNFSEWLNQILTNDFPEEMVAINFNLYEDTNNQWSIEFVGTSSFDINDSDWACDEVFATRENPFIFTKIAKWDVILDMVIIWVSDYMKSGVGAEIIKSYLGVGIGFVDGDISIIYQK